MIFVIDSADVGRMEEAKLAFDAVRQHEELSGVPVMLLANKQDLASSPRPSVLLNALRLGEVSTREWRLQGCVTQRALVQGGHGHSGHENEQLSGLRAGLGWLVCAMRERTASVWSATMLPLSSASVGGPPSALNGSPAFCLCTPSICNLRWIEAASIPAHRWL